MSHRLFLLFEMLFLMLLESNFLSQTKIRKASKNTLFLIHLVFQMVFLKMSD
jgi:hypothetical protein